MKPKILVYDEEWFPLIGYAWELRETDIIKEVRSAYMLSFSAIIDGKQITRGLCDYPGYKGGPAKEKELAKELWKLFDEADIIIGWNSNKFDNRKARTLFFKYRLGVPSPYKTIDLMRVWKQLFATPSNALKYVAEYADIQRKKETEGFAMWEGCDRGDMKWWKKMLGYNNQDSIVTNALYGEMLPWIPNHPTPKDGKRDCPNCHSDSIHKKGADIFRGEKSQRYKCINCGTNFYLKQ